MAFIIRPLAGRTLFRCNRPQTPPISRPVWHNYRLEWAQRALSTSGPLLKPTKPLNGEAQHKRTDPTSYKAKDKQPDGIEYIVQFKTIDAKKIFKQFYSVYGPLFVVCHIGVSLISLGFFCSLAYFVDLTEFVPAFMASVTAEAVLKTAGTGGKYIMAYAIHKVILPIRLGAAVWATRKIASRIEYFRKRIEKVKKD